MSSANRKLQTTIDRQARLLAKLGIELLAENHGLSEFGKTQPTAGKQQNYWSLRLRDLEDSLKAAEWERKRSDLPRQVVLDKRIRQLKADAEIARQRVNSWSRHCTA